MNTEVRAQRWTQMQNLELLISDKKFAVARDMTKHTGTGQRQTQTI